MFLSHALQAGPGPADDFWYAPVGTRTAAGARVTADAALRLSTVYKCVRAISETVAMLPLPVYKRLQPGKERAPEHPLARLLADPNPWQTSMQWREMMQMHAVHRGNGYSEILFDASGQESMLLPLHPDCVTPELLPNGRPRYRYRPPKLADGSTPRERVLLADQVLHLKGPSLDGLTGLNPIELEREAIGAAIISRDHGSTMFANGARPPNWIKMPGKWASDQQRDNWIASYHAKFGGANSGRTPVLDQGMELNALSVSNVDAQWIESRKYQDVDICGLYRVPPHKIGLLDDAKWANIEQQAIQWVTDCIMPWCVRWEQMLQRGLDFGEQHFVEHLLAMLLRGDTPSRFAAYGRGIQDGWMTRNEARELENMNPIEGLDTPLQPMNMAPAGSRGADQARGAPPSAEARAVVQAANSRALLIETAAANRIARKEAGALTQALRMREGAERVAAVADVFGDAHARFVADVLAMPTTAAQAYCEASRKRALSLLDQGTLGAMPHEDWAQTQTSALLRLTTAD